MYYQEVKSGEIRKLNSDLEKIKIGESVYERLPVFSSEKSSERNKAPITYWPSFKGASNGT